MSDSTSLQVYADGTVTLFGGGANAFLQTADTAAYARNFTGSDGLSLMLRGITAPNDGQGGFYQWNPNATGPDDGFSVLVPTGSTAGAWVRLSLTGGTIAPVGIVAVDTGYFSITGGGTLELGNSTGQISKNFTINSGATLALGASTPGTLNFAEATSVLEMRSAVVPTTILGLTTIAIGAGVVGGYPGTITIGSGVTLSAGILSAGGSGGTVTSVVAGSNLSGGTINSTGTIALSTAVSGLTSMSAATVTATTVLGLSGATTSGNWTIGSGSIVTATNATINSGTLNPQAITSPSIAATVMTVSGTLALAGATTSGNFAIASGSTVTATGAVLTGGTLSPQVLNVGSLTTAATLVGLTAGSAPETVTIGSGVTLSAGVLSAGGAGGTVTSITAGSNLTGGAITSAGTIALSATVSGLTSISAATVTATGTLALSGATTSGNFTIASASTVTATGAVITGGTFSPQVLTVGGLTTAATLVGLTAGSAPETVTIGANLSLSSGVLSATGGTSFVAHGLSVPAVGSFTWINQGIATAANISNGPLSMIAPKSANTVSLRFLGVAVPGSTPWTATLQMTSGMPSGAGGAFYAGMALSDGTKFITHSLIGTASATQVSAQSWTNSTSFSGTIGSTTYTPVSPCLFLRIYNDATNYHFQVSVDGVNFSDIATQAVASFLTATRVGLVVSSSASTSDTVLNVFGWEAVTGTGTALTF